MEGLQPLEPLLAQQLDPVVDDGVVGLGRAEAEGHQRRLLLQRRRDVEQVEQQAFGVRVGLGHGQHDVFEPLVEVGQRLSQLARAVQAEHGHGAVGLDLEHRLHHLPDPGGAGRGRDEQGKAHVAVLVELKVSGEHAAAVEDAGGREALGVEPLGQARGHGGGVFRGVFYADGDLHQRWRGQALRPVIEGGAGVIKGKGLGGGVFAEQREAGELRMLLPLEPVARRHAVEEVVGADLIGVEPGSTQPVGQPVALPGAVAPDCILRVLAGKKDHVAGGADLGKGARVEFVDQVTAARMLLHGAVSGKKTH